MKLFTIILSILLSYIPFSASSAPLQSIGEHGGVKSSGYGKDLSPYALEDYKNIRHVMVKID